MSTEKKRSFFERLTGARSEEENEGAKKLKVNGDKKDGDWLEEAEDAELTVDLYQTPTEIIIQTMVAGVKPDDLEIDIARDMITIRGNREESRKIEEEDYFVKELYWGSFSRTLQLPAEVEPEEAEATERHGLVTIRLEKVDKGKKNSIKIKSI